MAARCIGQNSELTISADFNGPVFVCPLLLTSQTAVKYCIKKKNKIVPQKQAAKHWEWIPSMK